MKIVICAKQVPDTTEVHMTPEFTLQRDFVAQVINPADESALEAGLRLREEVLPLAAYGTFLKGSFDGVHIITKGGSQGGEDAIARCITYLKEKLFI